MQQIPTLIQDLALTRLTNAVYVGTMKYRLQGLYVSTPQNGFWNSTSAHIPVSLEYDGGMRWNGLRLHSCRIVLLPPS